MCGSGGVGKTTIAAALGLAGRRQPGRQGARAHRRPGPAPRRRPRRRRPRQPGDEGAGGGVRRGRGRAEGRAVGGDARHQGGLGRADPPPRARRRGTRLGAVQPALPEHHQPLRAQPRLPRDGAAARRARVGRVRPRRRRHAAVAQRPRRARRPVADGRVLRQPAAASGSPCRTGRGCSTWRRSRSTRSPTGCSGRTSCRTSPSSSCSSRRWRRASSPAPARWRRCSATRAPTFVVVSTLEAAPAHEAGLPRPRAASAATTSSARSSPTACCRRS